MALAGPLAEVEIAQSAHKREMVLRDARHG